MVTSSEKITPLMQQYFEIKAQFSDTLLFFQVGDFFELFFDDAVQAASFLNITLTKRGQHQGNPIPLCGVPSQALDIYLTRLVKGGFKVAICEQLEVATPGKVVKRGITRVLTPGTLVDSNLLDDKSASYFCSFFPMQSDWGILFGELLTTQLFATVIPAHAFKTLESELARFFPDEILLPANKLGKQLQLFFKSLGYNTTFQADSLDCDASEIQQWLASQFQPSTQAKFKDIPALYGALSNFYLYLNKCQKNSLEQFNAIKFYEPENFLMLDGATQSHLELVRNNDDGSRKNSLLELIDKSATAMGSRMLKKWLMRPLNERKAIMTRQDAIASLMANLLVREDMINQIKKVSDLERVVGRIALDRGQLADYLQLKQALLELPAIKKTLNKLDNSELLDLINQSLIDFTELANLLQQALNDDQSKDWIVKQGFNGELDQIRSLVLDATQKFIELEQREQQQTGINSLKVRFNHIQGYYIEITNPNLSLVPSHYIRQQTLVGKERFVTIELQQLQVALEQARQNIDSLEQTIFNQIKQEVAKNLHNLRKVATGLAHLDALLGLACTAYVYGYTRPIFNDQQEIIINQGRHPVVEQLVSFIPNDTSLSDAESLWIITGPNMGGKSTYLRQVAVICILAQCGSFVPAQSASLPILDRIFTRIGASDNLAQGKSTFLVEMEETATICRQATKKSLVILDEVGRGTSTFDGLAIAQAVVEYIYEQVGARCLFATHYHELGALADRLDGIANYHAASKRVGDGIVLLHQILPGIADGSFGVEVAKCADLPQWVIRRAQNLLKEFNKEDSNLTFCPAQNDDELIKIKPDSALNYDLIKQIEDLDLENITPRQAFDFLWQVRQKLL